MKQVTDDTIARPSVGSHGPIRTPTRKWRRQARLAKAWAKTPLALLLGTKKLLGAPGLTTRNKKLLGLLASLLGARTLLGAPGLATRNKKLLGAPGLTTRNKKLLGLLASLLGARTLLGAPGHTTRNKKLLGLLASLLGARTLLGAPGLTTRNKKLLGAHACAKDSEGPQVAKGLKPITVATTGKSQGRTPQKHGL